MRMFASKSDEKRGFGGYRLLAFCSPCSDVKFLTTRKPPHTTLFRSGRNVFKSFAGAVETRCVGLFSCDNFVMFSKQMSAETFRLGPSSETFYFLGRTIVSALE